MTRELLKQIADRNNAFKKFKNKPSKIKYRLDYLRLRKSVGLNITVAKENSFQGEFEKARLDIEKKMKNSKLSARQENRFG